MSKHSLPSKVLHLECSVLTFIYWLNLFLQESNVLLYVPHHNNSLPLAQEIPDWLSPPQLALWKIFKTKYSWLALATTCPMKNIQNKTKCLKLSKNKTSQAPLESLKGTNPSIGSRAKVGDHSFSGNNTIAIPHHGKSKTNHNEYTLMAMIKVTPMGT